MIKKKRDYDIALMKLQDPVEYTNDISPICLPPNGINLATIGTKGYVTGWGDTQGTTKSLFFFLFCFVLLLNILSRNWTGVRAATSDNNREKESRVRCQLGEYAVRR